MAKERKDSEQIAGLTAPKKQWAALDELLDLLSKVPSMEEEVKLARTDIEDYKKQLAVWQIATNLKAGRVERQIPLLWSYAVLSDIEGVIRSLTISYLSQQVSKLLSPEFDASRRQHVREEITSIFNELQTIKKDLKESTPKLDIRQWQ